MKFLTKVCLWTALAAHAAAGCADDDRPGAAGTSAPDARDAAQDSAAQDSMLGSDVDAGPSQRDEEIIYRSAIQPVTRIEDAAPSAFIPPFEICRAPVAGDTATRADGKVCTNVSLAACTEPGKYFPDYADCTIVRRQRPYWPAPPARESRSDDPRLSDAAFLKESAWVTEQLEASGCTCCHDGRVVAAAQWDISRGPLWMDSLSDTGLALFTGLADSSVLGAYAAADNHGFDRSVVGVPTTDSARMKAFTLAELKRRGLSEAWARAVPPFGGPIYESSVKKPETCAAGQGIEPDGTVRWTGGNARYVYVLKVGSKNPGVPPNRDLPEGTLWRLDTLASEQPLSSGIRFGKTPKGTFQSYPERAPAAALVPGQPYQLYVLFDVAVPIVNCIFTFGETVGSAQPSAASGATDASAPGGNSYDAGATAGDAGTVGADAGAGMCALPMGDARGFGAPCNDTSKHTDCPCAANYCSKSPFDTQGYCSVTGCKENPGICPAGWSCFDVSMFAPGQPSVCMRP